VTTTNIVGPLDVIEQIGSTLIARAILNTTRRLGFQAREKTLHRRVVPDVNATAHTAGNPELGEQCLESLARLLASLIRMIQQLTRLASSPGRHDQRIGNKLRRHLLSNRPAHDGTGEQIKDHASSCGDIFALPSRPVTPPIDLSEKVEPSLV